MSRRKPNMLDGINPNPVVQVFLIFGAGVVTFVGNILERTGYADRYTDRQLAKTSVELRNQSLENKETK